MNINSKLYTHEADETALKALQAIPIFSQLLKSFMKVWSEKQFALQNMSSNLKLSEKQLPKYYNMLPPICDKLGIDVPDLYLTHDVNPNAYTSGDTKPFIVITSGLIETVPDELIPTVLAHECGHIACHHVLYHTMGRMLLNGTLMGLNFFGINEIAIVPLKLAFFHWMRCSEFSADRAAAICDGTSDNIVKMCMAFAGFDKDICGEGNTEAFMEQAIEYKKMVDEDKWNKTLEFMMYSQETHPLVAVRAYECAEWTKGESFANITALSKCTSIESEESILLPIIKDYKYYLGENYESVVNSFSEYGFNNVFVNRVTESEKNKKPGEVISISICGNEGFSKGIWIPANADIVITYYDKKTEKEICDEHPDEIKLCHSSKHYQGINYQEVVEEFKNMGFKNISCEAKQDIKLGWLLKEESVQKILINDNGSFKSGDWVHKNSIISIIFYSSKQTDEQ